MSYRKFKLILSNRFRRGGGIIPYKFLFMTIFLLIDITTEAALTKLQYLVGLNCSLEEIKIRLATSLVGEMG
jgi:hypothetical protein